MHQISGSKSPGPAGGAYSAPPDPIAGFRAEDPKGLVKRWKGCRERGEGEGETCSMGSRGIDAPDGHNVWVS